MEYLNKLFRLTGFVWTGCILLAMPVLAQQPDSVYLNLETLLEIGGANNLTIEQYKKRQELARADLAKAREWWLPEVYAGAQSQQLWGAAQNTDGGFYLDVDRGNLWTGLGLGARWDFGEGPFRAKAATLQAEASRYRTQAERNQVLLKTIRAYYDFLTAQLYYGAYGEMTAQADTIADQLEILVDAGIRFQSEVLLARSNRNHLEVQRLEAQNDYLQESAQLANLLNLPAGTPITIIDTLMTPLDLVPEVEWRKPSPDSAFIQRPEYLELQTSLAGLREEKKITTTGLLLPELSLGTYTSWYGGLFEKARLLRPEQDPDPKMLYPTSALGISLIWRIPLGRLTYKGSLKQYDARIALQENAVGQLENQVNEEVSSSRSQLITAHQRLELAGESQTLAREALQQSIQRQALGTVIPFEVFQAQEFYLRARLDYLKALTDYNKAQYSLYVALGNDL